MQLYMLLEKKKINFFCERFKRAFLEESLGKEVNLSFAKDLKTAIKS